VNFEGSNDRTLWLQADPLSTSDTNSTGSGVSHDIGLEGAGVAGMDGYGLGLWQTL